MNFDIESKSTINSHRWRKLSVLLSSILTLGVLLLLNAILTSCQSMLEESSFEIVLTSESIASATIALTPTTQEIRQPSTVSEADTIGLQEATAVITDSIDKPIDDALLTQQDRLSPTMPTFINDNMAGLTDCDNYCIDDVEVGQSLDEALAALYANDDVHSVDVRDGCISGIDTKCITWVSSSNHYKGTAHSEQSMIGLIYVELFPIYSIVELFELYGEPDHIDFAVGRDPHSDAGNLEGIVQFVYLHEQVSAQFRLHGPSTAHGITEQAETHKIIVGPIVTIPYYCFRVYNIVQWRGYGGEGVYFDEHGDIIDPIGDEENCGEVDFQN